MTATVPEDASAFVATGSLAGEKWRLTPPTTETINILIFGSTGLTPVVVAHEPAAGDIRAAAPDAVHPAHDSLVFDNVVLDYFATSSRAAEVRLSILQAERDRAIDRLVLWRNAVAHHNAVVDSVYYRQYAVEGNVREAASGTDAADDVLPVYPISEPLTRGSWWQRLRDDWKRAVADVQEIASEDSFDDEAFDRRLVGTLSRATPANRSRRR